MFLFSKFRVALAHHKMFGFRWWRVCGACELRLLPLPQGYVGPINSQGKWQRNEYFFKTFATIFSVKTIISILHLECFGISTNITIFSCSCIFIAVSSFEAACDKAQGRRQGDGMKNILHSFLHKGGRARLFVNFWCLVHKKWGWEAHVGSTLF